MKKEKMKVMAYILLFAGYTYHSGSSSSVVLNCHSYLGDYCTICNDSYFLNIENSCSLVCKSGYFKVSVSPTSPTPKKIDKCISSCHHLIPHCLKCTNLIKCTECKEGKYLHLDRCVDSCPEGFFKYQNPSTGAL